MFVILLCLCSWVCVDVCGVVCVVECYSFLVSGCCLLCYYVV